MRKYFKLPTATTLMMFVIILAAISTWILPAGQYSKLTNDDNKAFLVTSKHGSTSLPFSQKTLDSLSIKIPLEKFAKGDMVKPISIPKTYQQDVKKPQGFVDILQAPIKGIVDSIDIVLFILVIGGFMQIFNKTGAMLSGVKYLASRMKGRERLLIIILTFIFSFLGGSYGMDVESIVFYPVLVPLLLAAGYDLIVPLAIVFGGAGVGFIASFSNPFSTIIASNTLGINWLEGFYERLLFFFISTALFVWYLLRYADKVKKNPTASLVYQMDGSANSTFDLHVTSETEKITLTLKAKAFLLLFLLTFVSMIVGIIFLNWWTTEMSALFLGSALLIAIIDKMDEKHFVNEFTKGMESMLTVALIVGLARGVTIVLNDGMVSDSILYYASNVVQHFYPTVFILLIMLFYFFFTVPVSSSSGMAVLTMPIIGSLAILLNIPGREVVNSYLYGIGIMYLITPTGSVFPALTMVNVSYKAWLKFIIPFVIGLLILSALFLTIGINF
ncbi:YfcC family protein [Daejeonella sp.]|uniref:YfcC family protein n=1 Tax=Daejeonella sp. TaxID=2805397 RepID=UPI003982FE2D